MASPTPSPGLGYHVRDPREIVGLKLISLCVGTASMAATLAALYFFLRMRRSFRHDLVIVLLLADFTRGACFIAFPLVSFAAYHGGRIHSGSAFCQVSGFLLTTGIEAADVAALLIALHTVLYIVRPKRRGGGSGLYPYRVWAFAAVTLLPLLDASLSFAGGMPGYEDTGAMCYLPLRERWYRVYLAWVPRYVIFCLIMALYLALFAFVRFAQWRYARADSLSRRSSDTMLSGSTVVGNPVPPTPKIEPQGPPGDAAVAASREAAARSAPAEALLPTTSAHEAEHADSLGEDQGRLSAATLCDPARPDQLRKSVKFHPSPWGGAEVTGEESAVAAAAAAAAAAAPAPTPAAASSADDAGTLREHRAAPKNDLSARRMTWYWAGHRGQTTPQPATPRRNRLSMPIMGSASEKVLGTTPSGRRPPPFSPLIEVSSEELPESAKRRQHVSPRGSTHAADLPAACPPPTTAPTQPESTAGASAPPPNDPAAAFKSERRDSAGSSGGSTFVYEGMGSGSQVERTRSRVRKQLILLFLYPLVYIAMWMVPFLSHVIWFDNFFDPTRQPAQPFWLLCLSMISLAGQAALNATLFMWREKPWRHPDERREGWRRGAACAVRDGGGGGVISRARKAAVALLGCCHRPSSARGCFGGGGGGARVDDDHADTARRVKSVTDRAQNDGRLFSGGFGRSRQEMREESALARTRRRHEMAREANRAAALPSSQQRRQRYWWDADEEAEQEAAEDEDGDDWDDESEMVVVRI